MMTRILDIVPRFDWSLEPRSLFDRFFPEFKGSPFTLRDDVEWKPPSDITETEKSYIVTVDLPGIDMKNADISYLDHVLTIRGEKKKETGDDECSHCSERYSGTFERRFHIPRRVDSDGIDASYKDGVLRVVLPKSEKDMAKKIEIH